MEIRTLLYGENAQQTPARFEPDPDCDDSLSLARFELVAGSAPSYNNYCDLDRMLQTKTHLDAGLTENGLRVDYTAIAVKHGNPCGCGHSLPASEAIRAMVEGDLIAIHGGLVMLNFIVNEEHAEILLTHKSEGGRRLLDGIVAGGFDQGAIELLKRKKDKCRFLANPELMKEVGNLDLHRRFRYVRGGRLTQPNYTYVPNFYELPWLVGESQEDLIADFVLAWAIGSTSNSNTITIVKDGQLLGNGVGQQDRVGAAMLAVTRAKRGGHDVRGASAYSDSFFPFDDGPKYLISEGVKAIFTTSGSVNDKDTITACKNAGVSLCMVPDKEGRGFFGH
jgi:phosphoribosylaminoimidazolecarboxamide formyltransferase/IMP cyclohydrolase